MQRLNLDSTKVLLISIFVILVVAGGIIYYYNDKIQTLNDDFNTKLLLLNKDILTNLNRVQQDLQEDISGVRDDLSMEVDLLDNDLKNYREKSNEDIKNLNSLVDEIEKQSDIKLEELKEEISTIQVKSADFSVIIDNVLKSVVSVGTNRGQGSGAVIDDRGFIVTNYHVIERANLIRILTKDGNVYDATLIGFNDIVDIAVLKVDADLTELRFGNSDNVKIGERVIALGNPIGLSFTVTEGIVSAVHREGPNKLDIYLQIDVPINPGNSGGPLVNTNSRIIGINNFKIGGFEGLGFAIESNSVKEVTDDIIEKYLQQIE